MEKKPKLKVNYHYIKDDKALETGLEILAEDLKENKKLYSKKMKKPKVEINVEYVPVSKEEGDEMISRTFELLWGDNFHLISKAFEDLIKEFGDSFNVEYKKAQKELEKEWGEKEIPIDGFHALIANKLYKKLKKK